MMKTDLVKKLSKIVLIMHQQKVVEKIAKAENRIKVYNEQKRLLNYELNIFKEEANKRIEDIGYVIGDSEYFVYPVDALQICFICIMTGIYESDLFHNPDQWHKTLYRLKGGLSNTAKKIADIMQNTSIAIYDEEALFNLIF